MLRIYLKPAYFIYVIAIGGLVFNACSSGGANTDNKLNKDQPNIIWILADDLGYGDLGCSGNRIAYTPNIDKLASQGIMLTDFYMNGPVCTPSRAALLTGRDPQRNGLTNVIGVKDHHTCLPAGELLISQLLHDAGYKTGMIGKWHLGEAEGFRPNDRGFDYFFGGLLGGLDFWNHKFMDGKHALFRNDEEVHQEGEYITDLNGKEAVSFIRNNRDHPFFLYLSFFAVHTAMGPDSKNKVIQAPARWINYYSRQAVSDTASQLYFGCLSAMDEAVGMVLEELDILELADNTLVFFTSDNGPDPRQRGTAYPLRGTKHTLWEGGYRVPFIARWPGKIQENIQSDNPAVATDLFPTTLEIAGVKKPDSLKLDGTSILRMLTDNDPGESRTFCFSYIRESYFDSKEKSVRKGKWAWLNNELYDIENDMGQNNNVADSYPEILVELEDNWNDWVSQYPNEIRRWAGEEPRKPFREKQ